MQDPITTTTTTNPPASDNKISSEFDFAKAYSHGLSLPDIWVIANHGQKQDVQLKSYDDWKKDRPDLNEAEATDLYKGTIEPEFKKYKNSEFNVWDTSIPALPNTKEFSNAFHGRGLMPSEGISIPTTKKGIVTPGGIQDIYTDDQVASSAAVFKNDKGEWTDIKQKDKADGYFVREVGDRSKGEPEEYWRQVTDGNELIDPNKLQSFWGDKTKNSTYLGEAVRGFYSGTVPLVAKGVGEFIKMVGGDEIGNKMINWSDSQELKEDNDGLLYGISNMLGMTVTSMALGGAIGVGGEALGLGVSEAVEATEALGTTGAKALGFDEAATAGVKTFQKTTAEKIAEYTNRSLTTLEIASGSVDKWNQMGIKDKDQRYMYAATLPIMFATLGLSSLTKMFGSAERTEIEESLNKIYGEPLTKEILEKGTQIEKDALLKRISNTLTDKIKSISTIAQNGKGVSKYAATGAETAGVVSLMGIENAGVQLTYNALKESQSRDIISKLGNNQYTKAQVPYGANTGSRLTRTAYYKSDGSGAPIEISEDIWYAEQTDLASAKDFIDNGKGKFDISEELNPENLIAPIITSLLTVGVGGIFNALHAGKNIDKENSLNQMAIKCMQNPNYYQKVINATKATDFGKKYVTGKDEVITADKQGQVPSQNDDLKQDFINRLNYKMEVIKKYGLMGLEAIQGSDHELDNNTGLKSIEILKNIETANKKLQDLQGVETGKQDKEAITKVQDELVKLNKQKDYLMKPIDPENGRTKSQAFVDATNDKIRFDNFLNKKSEFFAKLLLDLKNKGNDIDPKELIDKTNEEKARILSNRDHYKSVYDDFKVLSGYNQFDKIHEILQNSLNDYHNTVNKELQAKGVKPEDFNKHIESLETHLKNLSEHYKFDKDVNGNIRIDQNGNNQLSTQEYQNNMHEAYTGIKSAIEGFRHTLSLNDSSKLEGLVKKYHDLAQEHSEKLGKVSDDSVDLMKANLDLFGDTGIIKGHIDDMKGIMNDKSSYDKVKEQVPYNEIKDVNEKEKVFNTVLNDLINQTPTEENKGVGFGGSYIDQKHGQIKSIGDENIKKHLKYFDNILENLKYQLDENRTLWQDKIEPNKDTNQFSPLHNFPDTRISQENYDKFNHRYNELKSKIGALNTVIDSAIKTRDQRNYKEFIGHLSKDHMVFGLLNEHWNLLGDGDDSEVRKILVDGFKKTCKILDDLLSRNNIKIINSEEHNYFAEIEKLYRTCDNEKIKEDIISSMNDFQKEMVDMMDNFGDGKLSKVMDNIIENYHSDKSIFWTKSNNQAFNANSQKNGIVPLIEEYDILSGANTYAGMTYSASGAFPNRAYYMLTLLSRLDMCGRTKENPSYKDLYKSYRDVIQFGDKDLIPNAGQEPVILHMLMHFFNPDNKHISKLIESEKSLSEKEYIKEALEVNGYASAGKTSVVTRMYLKTLQGLKGFNKEKPLIVKILVPTEDLIATHRDNLSNLDFVDSSKILTFHEYLNNIQSDKPDKYHVLIVDEGSHLGAEHLKEIKERELTVPKIFLADDSQPSSTGHPTMLLPVDGIGESTEPITQLYRTGVDQLQHFFNMLRSSRYDRDSIVKLNNHLFFFDKSNEAKPLGVNFSADEETVRNNFKKFVDTNEVKNRKDALLIVDTEKQRSDLIALWGSQYAGFIRTMEFANIERSNICAGIESKTVFLAVDILSKINGSTTERDRVDAVRRAIMAAPRAKEYLDTIGSGSIKSEAGKVNELLDVSSGIGYDNLKKSTLDRLNKVVPETVKQEKSSDESDTKSTSTIDFDRSTLLKDVDALKKAFVGSNDEAKLKQEHLDGKSKNTTAVSNISYKLFNDDKGIDTPDINKETQARSEIFRKAFELSKEKDSEKYKTGFEKLISLIEKTKEETGFDNPKGYAYTLAKIYENPLIQQILEGNKGEYKELVFNSPYLNVQGSADTDNKISGTPFSVKIIGKTGDKYIVDVYDINFHKNENDTALGQLSDLNKYKLGLYAGQLMSEGFIVNNLNCFNVFIKPNGEGLGLRPKIMLTEPISFSDYSNKQKDNIIKNFNLDNERINKQVATYEQLYSQDRIIDNDPIVRENTKWQLKGSTEGISIDGVYEGPIGDNRQIGRFIQSGDSRIPYNEFVSKYESKSIDKPNLAKSTSDRFVADNVHIGLTSTHPDTQEGIDLLYPNKENIWSVDNPGIKLNLLINRLLNNEPVEWVYEPTREGFKANKDGKGFEGTTFLHSIRVRMTDALRDKIMNVPEVKEVLDGLGIKTKEDFNKYGLDIIANESLPENKFSTINDRENGNALPINSNTITEFLNEKFSSKEDIISEAKNMLKDAFISDPNDETRDNLIAMNVERLVRMKELKDSGVPKPTIIKDISVGNARLLPVGESNKFEDLKTKVLESGATIDLDSGCKNFIADSDKLEIAFDVNREGYVGSAKAIFNGAKADGDYIRELQKELDDVASKHISSVNGDFESIEEFVNNKNKVKGVLESTEAFRFIETNISQWKKNTYDNIPKSFNNAYINYDNKGRAHINGERLSERVAIVKNILQEIVDRMASSNSNGLSDFTKSLYKPIFKDVFADKSIKYKYENLETKNLVTRFNELSLPNVWTDVKGTIEEKKADAINRKVDEQNKQTEDNDDEPFFAKFINKALPDYEFYNIENAKSELERFIGNRPGNVKFVDSKLLQSDDRILFGKVKDALITLATFGHDLDVEKNTVRHEAVHFILSNLIDPKVAVDIINSARKEMMKEGKINTSFRDVHEYIAEGFESYKKPTTVVGKFISWMKSLLNRVGLYKSDKENFYYHIENGKFTDSPIINGLASDMDFNKETKGDKYDDNEHLANAEHVFGGNYNLNVVASKLKNTWFNFSPISNKIDSKYFSVDVRHSISNFFNYIRTQYDMDMKKTGDKFNRKNNVILKGDVNDKNVSAVLDENGQPKSIHSSEMTPDLFSTALNNITKGSNAKMVEGYMIHQLGKDEDLFLTVMKSILPSYNLEKIYKNLNNLIKTEEERRGVKLSPEDVNEVLTQNGIKQLNKSAEEVNYRNAANPLMKALLSNIPLKRANIVGDKLVSAKEAEESKKVYISSRDVHTQVDRAITNFLSEGNPIESLTSNRLHDELEKIAVKGSKTEANIISSFLSMYGKLPYQEKVSYLDENKVRRTKLVDRIGTHYYVDLARTSKNTSLELLKGNTTDGLPKSDTRYYGSIGEKYAERKLNQMKDISNGLLSYFTSVSPRSYVSVKFTGNEQKGTTKTLLNIFRSAATEITKSRLQNDIKNRFLTGDTINNDVKIDFLGNNPKYKVTTKGVYVFDGGEYHPLLEREGNGYNYFENKNKVQISQVIKGIRDISKYIGLDRFDEEMISSYRGDKLNSLAKGFHNMMLGVKVSVGKDELHRNNPKISDTETPDVSLENAYKGQSTIHSDEFGMLEDYTHSQATTGANAEEMSERETQTGPLTSFRMYLPNIFYSDIKNIADTVLSHSTDDRNKLFKDLKGNDHNTQVAPSKLTDLWNNGSQPTVINQKNIFKLFYDAGNNSRSPLSSASDVFHNAIMNGTISFSNIDSVAEVSDHIGGSIFKEMTESDIYKTMFETNYEYIFGNGKGKLPVWTIPFSDKPTTWMTEVTHKLNGKKQSLAIRSGKNVSINYDVLSALHKDHVDFFDRERKLSMEKVLGSLELTGHDKSEIDVIRKMSNHSDKLMALDKILRRVEMDSDEDKLLKYGLTKNYHYNITDGKDDMEGKKVLSVGNALNSNQVIWNEDFKNKFNAATDSKARYEVIRESTADMFKYFNQLIDKSGVKLSSRITETEGLKDKLGEVMFHNFLTFNESLAQLSRGSSSYYNDMIDNIKRAAGVIAPGSRFVQSEEFGSSSRVVVMNDIGGEEKQFSTDVSKNLYTDGVSYINPVSYSRLTNASGGKLGSITRGAIKTVNFNYDTVNDNLAYFKFAQYPIDFFNLRQSEHLQSTMQMIIGDENWNKYKEQLLKDSTSFGKAIEEMAKDYDSSKHIDYVVHSSAYKAGLHAVNDYDFSSNDRSIDNATINPNIRDNAIDVSNSGYRVQQITTQDVLDVQKSIATQILYIAGLLPEDHDINNRIKESTGSFVNIQLDKLNKLTTNDELLKYVKEISANIIKRETVKNNSLFRDGNISSYAYPSKLYQIIVDEINKYIKPDMPGQSYVHQPASFKMHYSNEGIPYLAQDSEISANHGNVTVSGYTNRMPNPALYYVKNGDHYEYIESKEEVAAHSKLGNQIVYKPGEVVIPFNHSFEFGISPKSTLVDVMRVGEGKNSINLYDPRNRWDDNGKPIKMGKEDYSERLKELFKENDDVDSILKSFSPDVAYELKKRMGDNITKAGVIDAAANYYDSLNKALDVMVVRIPTANGSSASMNRIVAFLNGAANTIITSAKKNILDGSDYDADQLQVFFRSVDKQGNVEENDPYKLNQNKIFNAIEDFYHISANHSLVLAGADKSPIVKEARKIQEKDDFVNRPNELGSSVHVGALNRSDLQGHFALIQSVISRMVAIDADKKEEIFPKEMNLMHNNSLIGNAIETGDTNVQAAVDNASTGGALNTINFNQATTGVLSGMTMYYPDTNKALLEQMFETVTRNPIMLYAADIAMKSKGLGEKNTDVWHVLDKLKYENSFNWNGVDTDITIDVREQMANLKKYAAAGEQGRRSADFTSIISKGLPNDVAGLLHLKETLERHLGRSLKDFINDPKSGQERLEYDEQKNFLAKRSMKYSINEEEEYERAVRSSFNLPMYIGSQENVMSYIKALDATLDTSFKLMPAHELFYSDRPDSIKNTVQDITAREWKYENNFKDLNKMMNDHLAGMFLSDKFTEFFHDGKRYDLANGIDRTSFVLQAPEYLDKIKSKKEYFHNSFLDNVVNNTLKHEDFSYLELSNSKQLEPQELSLINNGWKELPEDIKEFFRVYNFTLNGLNFRHGSFTDIMDTDLESRYSKWADNLDIDDIHERLTQDDNKQLLSGLIKYNDLINNKKDVTSRGGKIFKTNFGKDSIANIHLNDGSDYGVKVDNPYLRWMNNSGDNMLYTTRPVVNNLNLRELKLVNDIRNGSEGEEGVIIRKSKNLDYIIKNHNKFNPNEDLIVSLRDGSKAELRELVNNNVLISPMDSDGHVLYSDVTFDDRSHSRAVLDVLKDYIQKAFPNVDIRDETNETSERAEHLAYIDNDGVVHYNTDKAEPGTLFHEVLGHMLVDALASNHPDLYKSFESQAINMIESNSPFVKRLLTSDTYRGLSKPMLIKEVIANLIGFTSHEKINKYFEGKGIELTKNEVKNIFDSNKSLVQKAWDWIKNTFRKMFNIPVDISNMIHPNMSIQDFANIMTEHIINREGPLSFISSQEYSGIMGKDFMAMANLSKEPLTEIGKRFNIKTNGFMPKNINPDEVRNMLRSYGISNVEVLQSENKEGYYFKGKYGMIKPSYASSLPYDNLSNLEDYQEFLNNSKQKRRYEYSDEEKAQHIDLRIRENGGILPKEFRTKDIRELDFNKVKDDSRRKTLIKEIATAWKPNDNTVLHQGIKDILIKHLADTEKTAIVFGKIGDEELMPKEVLDKFINVTNFNKWVDVINYNDMKDHPEYKSLFNSDMVTRNNPMVNITKGSDGTMYVSLYDVTKDTIRNPEEGNKLSLYNRIFSNSAISMKKLRFDNSKGSISLHCLGIIAQDLMSRNDNVQIKDIGVIQMRGSGIDTMWLSANDFYNEQKSLAYEDKYKRLLNKDTLGKTLDPKNIKPFHIDDRKYLLSIYNNDSSKPAYLKRLLSETDLLSAQDEMQIYSSRVRDILKGKKPEQLNHSEIDELNSIWGIIRTLGKTPMMDWQENSNGNINDLQKLFIPSMAISNEFFQRLRTVQLDVSNQIVREAQVYKDKLIPIYESFIKDYEATHEGSRLLKLGVDLTDKYYDKVLVQRRYKDENNNEKSYNSNFIYWTNDEKLDPLHGGLAKENNVSDDILKKGSQLADIVDDLMIKAYKNYRWTRGDWNHELQKKYSKMTDAEVLKEIGDRSAYKRGMLPVIDMSPGGLTTSGNLKEAYNKKKMQIESAHTMFENMSEVSKKDATDADHISDELLNQMGIDSQNRTPLGSQLRLWKLGLKSDPLTGEITVEDVARNNTISRDVETMMNYFTVSTIRKINYEQHLLPYVNLNKCLLYDMKVNKGVNVEGIEKYIDLWVDGAVKNTRKKSDAKFPGLDIKLDPLFSRVTSVTRTIALFGNINVATMVGFSNALRASFEGIANTFVERGLPTGLEMGKASALFLSDNSKAIALAHHYQVVDRYENDLTSNRYNVKGKRHFWSDFIGNYMISSVDRGGRMIGMIAKMLHDGSWDAHSVDKNGNVVYDHTKDKQWTVKDGNVLHDDLKKSLVAQGRMKSTDDKLTHGYDDQSARIFSVIGDKWIVGAQNSKVKAMLSQYMLGRMVNMFHTFVWTIVNNAFEEGKYMPDAARRVIQYDSEGKPICKMEKLFVEGYVVSLLKGAKMLYDARSLNFIKTFEDMKKNEPEKYKVMQYNLIKVGTMVATYTALSLLYTGLVDEKEDKATRGNPIPGTRLTRNVKYAYMSIFASQHLLGVANGLYPGLGILNKGIQDKYGNYKMRYLLNLLPGKTTVTTLNEFAKSLDK